MATRRVEFRRSVLGRVGRSNFLLVVVALMPILLIGYSLEASIRALHADAILVLGTLLITGVGAYVIWDAILSSSGSLAFDRRRASRRTRTLHR